MLCQFKLDKLIVLECEAYSNSAYILFELETGQLYFENLHILRPGNSISGIVN